MKTPRELERLSLQIYSEAKCNTDKEALHVSQTNRVMETQSVSINMKYVKVLAENQLYTESTR